MVERHSFRASKAMRLASLGYVPPPKFGGAQTFYDNVRKFPTTYELILFSEHDWPGALKLKGSPEQVKGATFPNGKVNPFSIHNLLWLTALRICRERGVTHMLYLEADCRVGRDHWDAVVFDEFFSAGRPLICGGSLAVYNPCNYSPEAARRWAQLVSRNIKRNFPIPTYGWLGAADKQPSCIFANGALAIYEVAWMARYFDLDNSAGIAVQGTAYDMMVGSLIWKDFEEDAYEVVGHLESVFSGYGDVLTTEADRMKMLRDGQCVAVHQVKSNATI